jgi:hypothetical protein
MTVAVVMITLYAGAFGTHAPTAAQASPAAIADVPIATVGWVRSDPVAASRIRELSRGAVQLSKPTRRSLSSIIRSIDRTLGLTSDELRAWFAATDSNGRDNTLVFPFPGEAGPVPFNFPAPVGGGELTGTGIPDAPYRDTFSMPGFIIHGRYLNGTKIIDYTLPITQHLSLVSYGTDFQLWNSLGIYNGSLTWPLADEKDGSVTLSFATSIWPDGTKIVYMFVTSLALHDDRLGRDQSILTDSPMLGTTADKNNIFEFDAEPARQKRWLATMKRNIQKPILIDFLASSLLQEYDSGDGPNDASISGIETNSQYPILDKLRTAYLEQSAEAFRSAVTEGQQVGVFAPTHDGRVSKDSLISTLQTLRDLASTFTRVPFATTTVIKDSTSPVERG